MSELGDLSLALEQVLSSGDDITAVTRVCVALVRMLPGDGAAVTMMMSDVQRETVYASDHVIQTFEALQYTMGEGPSLLAFTEGRPVLVPDASTRSSSSSWPMLAVEFAELPIAGIFCFPMSFGVINVGVCAIYRRVSAPLTAAEVSLVLDALEMTTLVLLQLRGEDRNESLLGRWLAIDGHSRRQVHQATGMVMGQLGVSAQSAFARLRGQAFADGVDLEHVAAEIVSRRLVLSPDPP